ncbi:hypothetical protein CCR75_007002 [Bremia lactucae]|uniref:Uncharacterized protein n=1 Tax=Bremia lactucae TaxID=4779 RepID=A0A976FHD9_BRELC|nr:hypothetical protein CCR75_007002 [Bremia lactucae]
MKVNVYVAAKDGGAAQRVAWYVGTSDAQVEKAIRIQLSMPRNTDFLLRDADGDVVPASSTLPNGQHYTVLMPHEDGGCMSQATTSLIKNKLRNELTISPSSPKKRKLERSVVTPAPGWSRLDRVIAVNTPLQNDTLPSTATIIAQFVDTFTRPIANDDNVGFIPNEGRFALYDLYCLIVCDTNFCLKRKDMFYKMTSMYGKIDRQRVNRYYQCPLAQTDGKEYVQCKPRGKGVLLRRYRKVGTAEELEHSVKTAPFIVWLQLDHKEVVTLYERFVTGFVPISKRDYGTYRYSQLLRNQNVTCDF